MVVCLVHTRCQDAVKSNPFVCYLDMYVVTPRGMCLQIDHFPTRIMQHNNVKNKYSKGNRRKRSEFDRFVDPNVVASMLEF